MCPASISSLSPLVLEIKHKYGSDSETCVGYYYTLNPVLSGQGVCPLGLNHYSSSITIGYVILSKVNHYLQAGQLCMVLLHVHGEVDFRVIQSVIEALGPLHTFLDCWLERGMNIMDEQDRESWAFSQRIFVTHKWIFCGGGFTLFYSLFTIFHRSGAMAQ